MNKRLVAFGCSLTQGIGLPDIFDVRDPATPLLGPSKLAWPNKLAKHLNCSVVNKGHAGASNKQITWNIQNFSFKEDDIVVIQWTHLDRFCIIRDNSQYVDQCYNDEIVTMISAGRMEQGQGQSKLFFKHFHSISDMEVDMHTRIDYINFLLERKGITVFNFLAEPHYKRSFNWFETKLLDTTIGPIRHKLPTALDNSHPGEECMQVIADELYKEITELL